MHPRFDERSPSPCMSRGLTSRLYLVSNWGKLGFQFGSLSESGVHVSQAAASMRPTHVKSIPTDSMQLTHCAGKYRYGSSIAFKHQDICHSTFLISQHNKKTLPWPRRRSTLIARSQRSACKTHVSRNITHCFSDLSSRL